MCCFICRHVVNTFLLIYQIGTCCVYVVFVSENIHSVLTSYFEIDISEFQVMLCVLLPLILINYVRDLKYLAPFSAVANAVTIVCFGIILYYLFRETPTLEGKSPAGKLANFPLFFGTVLFALEAIGVVSIFSYFFFIIMFRYNYHIKSIYQIGSFMMIRFSNSCVDCNFYPQLYLQFSFFNNLSINLSIFCIFNYY